MSIIIAKQPQPYFADASAEKELIGPFFFCICNRQTYDSTTKLSPYAVFL